MRLTRYTMYRRIRTVLPAPLTGKILGISGIENFYDRIDRGASEMVETRYPEVDMQNLPFPDEEFDYVISDQVLMHLPDARQALQEAFRVLRKGGIGIHTAAVLNPIFLYPGDYCRFTCDGLRAYCPAGAEVLQCESWGNRLAFWLMLLYDPVRAIQIPERPGLRRWLATYNDPRYPIHTWIVARKT